MSTVFFDAFDNSDFVSEGWTGNASFFIETTELAVWCPEKTFLVLSNAGVVEPSTKYKVTFDWVDSGATGFAFLLIGRIDGTVHNPDNGIISLTSSGSFEYIVTASSLTAIAVRTSGPAVAFQGDLSNLLIETYGDQIAGINEGTISNTRINGGGIS